MRNLAKERLMKEFIIDSKRFVDIKPLFAGMQSCHPGHSYGPFVRRQFLIHFCLSGKGVFIDPRGTYRISAGELFVIRPGEVTTYIADKEYPWEYMWLGFDGALTGVFGSGKSVYSYSRELGERLRDAIARDVCDAHIYSSILHELISSLFSLSPMDSDTVATVKSYIDYNYMGDISVSNISDRFGFERSYLYRIFKERYGLGIKEYIKKVRMESAAVLLSEGHPAGVSGRVVGYKDEFNFSKSFKKYYGVSPSAYKKKLFVNNSQ